MFDHATYQAMHNKICDPLKVAIILMVNNGTGFDRHASHAVMRSYTEHDLVPGGSIRQGDVKLIISMTDIPTGISKLERKDRIEVDGVAYGVIHWDNNTRTVKKPVAVEVTIRG